MNYPIRDPQGRVNLKSNGFEDRVPKLFFFGWREALLS